ncbi:tripartite tricarboxylate transporter substrate binding protein [Mediterraneibacter agrestimuris]|uniref:tripartite tricarboxylate transporter substrate binding protein n=1 Tax=Mediterraneibacter agrestimuris TaxID=2941333 RepID=UPI00203D63BD|nr:tripartite tricarboxylate transporter substrate binding protein [Mediterraneibacter agrestimuris]
MKLKKIMAGALIGVMALAAVGCSPKEKEWPSENITVYVPASPGGTTDNTCRVFAEYLEEELGTSISVVNQEGASGGIAADEMMAADPDGYTLMYYHNTMMTGYITGAVDYKATDKMKVIDITCRDYPGAICVKADSKYETLQDLVDDIKANPETVRIGVETGGGSFLQAKMFEDSIGGKLKYLDYGADAERVAGLLGDKLDLIFLNVGSAKEYEESGDFRMLGVYGTERNPLAPDLETCQEQGIDFVWGGQMMAWFGQKDLPEEIVVKFNTAMEKILADPEVGDRLETLGFYPTYEDSETATKSMNDWLDALLPYKDLM